MCNEIINFSLFYIRRNNEARREKENEGKGRSHRNKIEIKIDSW